MGQNQSAPLCEACSRLQEHIQDRKFNVPSYGYIFKQHPIPRIVLHQTFKQLSDSSSRGCAACHCFQHALVNGCYSKKKLEELQSSKSPVLVLLPRLIDEMPKGLFHIMVELQAYVDLKEPVLLIDEGRSLFHTYNFENPISLAKKWLKDCTENHTLCSLQTHSRQPTRLIYLGEDDSPSVSLIDTSSAVLSYVALSYCWGQQDTDCRTILQNLDARRAGIKLKDLPSTLLDAIWVCRQLNIPYIWIDALCIIQDDPEDWTRESSRMHEVYGSAAMTLAVCSSGSVSEGFVHDRPLGEVPCRIDSNQLRIPPKQIQQVQALSPLMWRGWTLQEEMLSPRILYWSRHGVFWKCLNNSCAEDTAFTTVPTQIQVHNPRRHFLSEISELYTSTDVSGVWNDTLERYTPRDFTNIEDRFPALSGVAAACHRITGDEYVAGLWKKSLPGSLLWEVIGDHVPMERPTKYIAPSWSWASLPPGQGIKAYRNTSGISLYSTVETTVMLESAKDTTSGRVLDPFGRIASASMTISGRFRPLHMRPSASSKPGFQLIVTPATPPSIGIHPSIHSFDSPEYRKMKDREGTALNSSTANPMGLSSLEPGFRSWIDYEKGVIMFEMDFTHNTSYKVIKLDLRPVVEYDLANIFCLNIERGVLVLMKKAEEDIYIRIGCCASIIPRNNAFEDSFAALFPEEQASEGDPFENAEMKRITII